MHGRMESPNTSPQANKLNPIPSRLSQSNRLDVSHRHEIREPRCILAVLHVPFEIRFEIDSSVIFVFGLG